LLEAHVRHTGSTRALAILERWDDAEQLFWRVIARTLEGAAERDALEVVSA
jgi:glutamate synthase domain-containing protein 3